MTTLNFSRLSSGHRVTRKKPLRLFSGLVRGDVAEPVATQPTVSKPVGPSEVVNQPLVPKLAITKPVGPPPEVLPQAQEKQPPAFSGLTGRDIPEVPPEPTPVNAPTESVEQIEARLITAYDKKKRGRPSVGKQPMTAAERKQKSRAKKAEASAVVAAEKELQNRIDAILHENRDAEGRLHGETSGGDILHEQERKAPPINGGRRVSRGWGSKQFEDKKWVKRDGRKLPNPENAYTFANRHNYYAPCKWDREEKEQFAEELAAEQCIEIKIEITSPDGKDECSIFVCGFHDFDSPDAAEVQEHFLKYHRKYILAMTRLCEPHDPIELLKKPRRCTEADHQRWARIFSDQLPIQCRWCKAWINPEPETAV